MRKTIVLVAGVLALLIVCISDQGAAASPAKAFRATDMRSSDWDAIQKAQQDVIVEFRSGDEIPVSFASEGDLLETTTTGVSYVKVKRDFWLKISSAGIQMSLDGSEFKPISDVLKGSFQAGAGAQSPGQPANSINLLLQAYLK